MEAAAGEKEAERQSGQSFFGLATSLLGCQCLCFSIEGAISWVRGSRALSYSSGGV